MPDIAEQARILARKHLLKYNQAVMRGNRGGALWHWDQHIIWGAVYVRHS